MDVAGVARVAAARVCGGLRCGLGRACGAGSCESAPRRAKACRWLQSFFPIQAEREAKARGHREGPWQDFWQLLWEEAVREGVVLPARQVCCRTGLDVRVPLRSNHRPATLCPSVLPVFAEDGALLPLSEETRRAWHVAEGGGGATVHGSVLFALPSDFLCKDCVRAFRVLVIDNLKKEDVEEWKRRLCLRSSCDAGSLKREQKRLLARDRPLACASQAQFREFRDLALAQEMVSLFDATAVAAVLVPSARKALEAAMFCRGPSVALQEWCPRRFGVMVNHQGTRPCLPLPRGAAPGAQAPASWEAYTGEPGDCSEEVWVWRLWALARGGFDRLSVTHQRQLEAAEALNDGDYLRVSPPPATG